MGLVQAGQISPRRAAVLSSSLGLFYKIPWTPKVLSDQKHSSALVLIPASPELP